MPDVELTICNAPIPEIEATPSASETILKATDPEEDTKGFRGIVQRGLNDFIVSTFNGVGGLAESVSTTLKLGTNKDEILRRKNDCEKPTFLVAAVGILRFFWNNRTIHFVVLYIALAIIRPGDDELWLKGTCILVVTYLVIAVFTITYFTLQIPSLWHFISTKRITKVQERWRRALFTISFSNTMQSISKEHNKIYGSPASKIVPEPSYSASKFIPKGFSSIDQAALNYLERRKDLLTLKVFGPALKSVSETFRTSPENGINRHDTERKSVFDSNACNTPPTKEHFNFCSIDQAELTNLVKTKDLHMLQHKFNGVKSLAAALGTNLEHGIDSHDIERRITVFGSNACNNPLRKEYFYFIKKSLKDPNIIIMLLSAILAIKGPGAKDRWYESSSIFVFTCVFIVSSSVNNFNQDRQMHRLSKRNTDIEIEVVREGRRLKIPISEVVVGDVVILNVGDQIPADGVFIDGHSLLVDESILRGISDRIEVDMNMNPFLFSGSEVVDGHAQMLVTSVGMNTDWGKMISSTASDSNEQTSQFHYLKKFTSFIEMVSVGVAYLLFHSTFTKYFGGVPKYEIGNFGYKEQFMDIIDKLKPIVRVMTATTIDIPQVATITLDWCLKRMMDDQVKVRKLSACQFMGFATVICPGKTGNLTMNQMKVTNCWIGLDQIENDSYNLIDPKVLELFHQGVGLNTTGSISGTTPEYFGSPTEKALLSWAVMDLSMDMDKVKQESTILHVKAFNSWTKQSGVCVRKHEDNSIHVHGKGAAEIILAMCSKYYQKNGVIKSINPEERLHLENIIKGMAASSLRCIAFVHNHQLSEDGFTLLGIVGIKDPCRPEAKEAIEVCRSAGMKIKMITGENIFTAKAIATECGILTVGQQGSNEELIIEGEEFRNYTDEERMSKVDNIVVMARSTPFDKLLMVLCLQRKGHIAAVTGHDLDDALTLKRADIGISMGLHGTAVARESSDIVILDDSITSIANIIRWGRCVFNNIQNYVQFQLTVTIAALVISSVAKDLDRDPPLTTVQMLWVNLIIDTLGAQALSTEWPDIEIMYKPSMGRDTQFVTHVMRRNFWMQALYQTVILLTFRFKGRSFFNVSDEVNNTIIFNSFVFCHVFNLFNARKLETKNIFEGLHKNRLFLGIIGVIVVIQVLMVEYLNKFANTEKLNRNQWAICLGVAVVSWPIGWLVKFISYF